MRYRFLLLALPLFTGAMLYGQPAPRATIHGKPVYEQEVYPVVENSLSRMWHSADAVVEVKIESTEVKAVGRTPLVRAFHTSRVLRVLKGDMKKDCSLIFSEAAGQLELADRVLRGGNGDPLPAGERYILFLSRSEPAGTWALQGQRAGAFRLREGRVQPQGFGAVADEQRNLRERQFSDELERLAGHNRPKSLG